MTNRSTKTGLTGFAGPVLSVLLTSCAWCAFATDITEGGNNPRFCNTERLVHTTVVRLDGAGWSMAIDPKNEGRQRKWYDARPVESCQTQVPGVMQKHFPDYHGVAWYWREVTAPANPHSGGRYLLRFHAVDYLAEVWMNGIRVGLHEGSEEPFEFDATSVIKPNALNFLAVRVLNATDRAIDGISI